MDDQSNESVLFIYRKTRELQPISVRRCFAIANKELQINEEIRDKEVRVIGAEGEQLGIMSSRDAYNMAQEKNLDLVKIAPQAQPPVCRIMDYGKYRFEQAKREKESRKTPPGVPQPLDILPDTSGLSMITLPSLIKYRCWALKSISTYVLPMSFSPVT